MFHASLGRWGRVLLALTLVGMLGTACGGDDEESGGDAAASGGSGAEVSGDASVADGGGGSGDDAGTLEFEGTAVPSVGPSIIKSADIRIETKHGDFAQSVQQVESAAARYGGFVLSTSLDDASSKSGVIVLRVPAEDFETALRDVKGAGELLGENISGKDVSQEFIDLEARINNLQSQEAVFLDLMDRATTITQTVRIQNQLSSLQLDIEQLQGRLNFLEDRTALGTISVSLVEEGAPAPSDPNSFELAWERAVDVLEGVGASLIFLVVAVLPPLSLLGLVVLLIVKQVKPRMSS